MGTDYKSVRLTGEAYETLERRKREDETFSEAVERLASERPISDLAGLFTDDDIEAIRTGRTRSYDAYADRREREYEK
jgi:predicted CopG family antitoxin